MMTYNEFVDHLKKLNIMEAKTNVFCNNLLLIDIKDEDKCYIEISTGAKDGRTYLHVNYDSAYEQIITFLFLGSKNIKFYMLYKDYVIPINTIINHNFIMDNQEYIWNNPSAMDHICKWVNAICNDISPNLNLPITNTYKEDASVIAYSPNFKCEAKTTGIFPTDILFDESNSYIKFSYDMIYFNFNFMKECVCGVN